MSPPNKNLNCNIRNLKRNIKESLSFKSNNFKNQDDFTKTSFQSKYRTVLALYSIDLYPEITEFIYDIIIRQYHCNYLNLDIKQLYKSIFSTDKYEIKEINELEMITDIIINYFYKYSADSLLINKKNHIINILVLINFRILEKDTIKKRNCNKCGTSISLETFTKDFLDSEGSFIDEFEIIDLYENGIDPFLCDICEKYFEQYKQLNKGKFPLFEDFLSDSSYDFVINNKPACQLKNEDINKLKLKIEILKLKKEVSTNELKNSLIDKKINKFQRKINSKKGNNQNWYI